MSENNLKGVGLSSRFRFSIEKDRLKGNPDHFYPRIIINRRKRWSLTFAVAVSLALVTAIVFGNNLSGYHWWMAVGPIGFVGLLLCLAPPSEQWEYKPWQAVAEQVERHVGKS